MSVALWLTFFPTPQIDTILPDVQSVCESHAHSQFTLTKVFIFVPRMSQQSIAFPLCVTGGWWHVIQNFIWPNEDLSQFSSNPNSNKKAGAAKLFFQSSSHLTVTRRNNDSFATLFFKHWNTPITNFKNLKWDIFLGFLKIASSVIFLSLPLLPPLLRVSKKTSSPKGRNEVPRRASCHPLRSNYSRQPARLLS